MTVPEMYGQALYPVSGPGPFPKCTDRAYRSVVSIASLPNLKTHVCIFRERCEKSATGRPRPSDRDGARRDNAPNGTPNPFVINGPLLEAAPGRRYPLRSKRLPRTCEKTIAVTR